MIKFFSSAIILLLLLCSSSCRRWDERFEFGLFVYTETMQANELDWEGGNTRLVAEQLCNLKSRECFKAEVLDFKVPGTLSEVSKQSKQAPWLVLRTEDKGFRFFSVQDGEEVECKGCDFEQLRRVWTQGSVWIADESRLLFLPKAGDAPRLAYLSFSPSIVEFVQISYPPGIPIKSPFHDHRVSTSAIAFASCEDKQCTIVLHNFETKATSAAGSCVIGDRFYFDGDVPKCTKERPIEAKSDAK